MIHTQASVGGFELCIISHKIQCPHRMKYLMEGIVYCDRGTCLLPSKEARRLNKEKYDVLTILFFAVHWAGTVPRSRRGSGSVVGAQGIRTLGQERINDGSNPRPDIWSGR